MNLLLGGSGSQPAIDWHGTVLTYADVEREVRRWPHAPMHDASALSVPEALVCVFAAARQGVPVHVEDPAARPERADVPSGAELLVATSGSTGRPRPLARTWRSWTDSFAEFTNITEIGASDRVLVTGPLHATMHLFGAVHALTLGACVTDNELDATVAHAVPSVLRTLVEHAPHLRLAVVAGTALRGGAEQLLGGMDIVEYYGAAELSLVAARRGAQPLRLLRGIDAEIRGGLLWVRSPYTVLGTDEWVGVGDLAELHEGRELVVFGRGSAAVNVGGTTVIAEDVEQILESFPGVRGAAVIGTPHDVLGETVTAVLELDPDAELAAIKAHARSGLVKEAIPRRWMIVETLPRTGSGKVARGRVKDSLND
ncbi:AMP-binding protein [Rhodococcus sp. G-MC3]|uniref:class I adenylate-forming enzyme family protein n=1 Tax=Rhodococcus sp. G-MC3 TaxID=3046209 RepID=UPI0024BBE724|nr:AMP-binding protein [Rhodococcus sp. G-MC3]MDJ0392198.1 AMP-binding protein [Rhodococcus sp. G-MC3]